MLRIARIPVGGEGYYFRTVAATTDLPSGLVEADPYWLGGSAVALGLPGGEPVDGTTALGQLRSAIRGVDPLTGEQLLDRRRHPVANGAFDVVLSVPKSVSLLHALASAEGSARVEAAHRAAVDATVGHAGAAVVRARRRQGGEAYEVGVEGVAALCFVHRTSRAGDPHLHSHVLVANLVLGEDGRWSAPDLRPLFGRQRVVRALFESQLRHELGRAGVEFGPMRGDFADVKGIPAEAVRAFSRQSELIREYAAARGLDLSASRSRAGDALIADAAAALRPEKDRGRPYEELRQEWRERSYEVGLSPARIERAAGLETAPSLPSDRYAAPPEKPSLPQPASWLSGVRTSPDGSFSAGDATIALCCALPRGAPISTVEKIVAGTLQHPQVVPLGGAPSRAGEPAARGAAERAGWPARFVDGGERFTTASQLELAERSAERLGELARGSALAVMSYTPGERPAALEALSLLQPEAHGSAVVAVTLGSAAARRLEGECGHQAVPLRKAAAQLAGRLGAGDVVVLTDAGSWQAGEVEACLRLALDAGALPLLFGAERSLGQAVVLRSIMEEAPRVPALAGAERSTGTTRSAAPVHATWPGLSVDQEGRGRDTGQVLERLADREPGPERGCETGRELGLGR